MVLRRKTLEPKIHSVHKSTDFASNGSVTVAVREAYSSRHKGRPIEGLPSTNWLVPYYQDVWRVSRASLKAIERLLTCVTFTRYSYLLYLNILIIINLRYNHSCTTGRGPHCSAPRSCSEVTLPFPSSRTPTRPLRTSVLPNENSCCCSMTTR